jgi:hypothetical protein
MGLPPTERDHDHQRDEDEDGQDQHRVDGLAKTQCGKGF